MSLSKIPSNPISLERIGRFIPQEMRFHVVMAKSLRDLMSPWMVLMVALGILPVIIFSLAWRVSFQGMSLEMQTYSLVGYFMIVTFMWLAGFYLAYIISTRGVDSITKEDSEGTLLIMVSKPISRFQFILGKFLALLLTTLFLELVILFSSILLFWGVLGLDPDTFGAVLGLVPWIFLYSIIVSLVFDSITIAISTLLKNRVVMTVILTIIIVFVFIAGMAIRLASYDTYENYHLYYLDGGYHLGNAYTLFLDGAGSGRMTPQIQAWLGIFTGTYRAGAGTVLTMFLGSPESFDPDIGAMPPSLEKTNYVNRALSTLLCLAASAAILGVAKVAMERKEVH
jgi:ABC-type transport system involved in multi-copper enzyme maturation permease subunit